MDDKTKEAIKALDEYDASEKSAQDAVRLIDKLKEIFEK